MAKSLVDYIFRWMGTEFLPGYREANRPAGGDGGGGEAAAGRGDAESEPKPAATKASGLADGQGKPKTQRRSDGSRGRHPGGKRCAQPSRRVGDGRRRRLTTAALLERAGLK